MSEVVAASRPGQIVIRGARTHNLKNIDLTLPANQLVIVTGVSGSGKSSLAFDTLYAEGQRRYVESLSAYARQFLERMEKPDVDRIDGIAPAIAIQQKSSLRNPRSTVGTTTEIHDYLRLLFARVGRTICRNCGQEVVRESAEIAAKQLAKVPDGIRLLIGYEIPIVEVPDDLKTTAMTAPDADTVSLDGLPLDDEHEEPVRSALTRASAGSARASASSARPEPFDSGHREPFGSVRPTTFAEDFGAPGRSAKARSPEPVEGTNGAQDRPVEGRASAGSARPELVEGRSIAQGRPGRPMTSAQDWLVEGRSEPSRPLFAEATAEARADAIAATIESLRRRGFARLIINGEAVNFDGVDPATLVGRSTLQVVVDRVKTGPDMLGRLTESIETAYHEGGGAAFAIEVGEGASSPRPPHPDPLPRSGGEGTAPQPPVPSSQSLAPSSQSLVPSPQSLAPSPQCKVHLFSERFECGRCGISYEVPQPRLFSFNNPFGACPTCHGFGNIIELDMDLVVPDRSKSIQQNAIEPWSKPHYRSQLVELKRAARAHGVRLNVPWSELTDHERGFVIEGNGEAYHGIRGFFRWLERKKYKVHVRVFLSRYRGYLTCPECGGARLRREARDVRVGGMTIDQLCALTVAEARTFFESLKLMPKEQAIADRVVREIRRRLDFLSDVGLDYLTLDRLSSTLSGGEAQRINLATSLGSSLVGTLYVLDEPSIGLHPRDNDRLVRILQQLRDQGNTVVVVEHDADMIRAGDYIVDLGLGAGTRGGKVVYAGALAGLAMEQTSLTAKYLRGELAIPVPVTRRRRTPQVLRVLGASEHNLQDIDVEIPLTTLTCVTGVSGSGKSTLVHDVLYAAVKRAKGDWDRRVGAHRKLDGIELISDVALVDQAPIGRTPRSNPVTYLKAFDPIRELFASTKDARSRALTASHFSFNVPGGRCDACEGEGELRVEMQFLADVFVPCDQCDGKRFKPQVLEVLYRGKRVDQVLDLTVREALTFFSTSPKVVRRLQVLDEIGLGYLRLGQPATTLSGGEAQRIKIAAHLSSHSAERTLYILDEPTTGLHFDDIAKLLTAFRKLLQAGHTLLVIEHNLDVIKTADWIIDLGPEGGAAGGRIVAVGTPEQVAQVDISYTGRYLRRVLAAGRSHAYAGA